MLLTEGYKNRLCELAGINPDKDSIVLDENTVGEGKFSSVYDLTKDQFLGKPVITTNANAKFLKPSELLSLEDVKQEPFLNGKYNAKFNEDGAVVFDGDKIIASYHFGDTLVVDKKYRGLGIAKELVYQWRTRYPDVAQASARTKASQAIQKSVWNRIEADKFRDEFINKKITKELYRICETIGVKQNEFSAVLKEAEDLYANSSKRIKFDMNVMKQAIERGMEVGLIFQSDNDKYKMPIWKTRIVQPVTMGYDKKGQLVVRGIHVTGQSEKKAIETGVRSAEAKNEWRLFKVSNIKSMFLTGRLFQKVSLPGYNPNDSAMTKIIAKFNPQEAIAYQRQLKNIKQAPINPEIMPTTKPVVQQKTPAKPVAPKTPIKPTAPKEKTDQKRDLEKRINKLNKLI